MLSTKRQLAAIMFSDIVGYTALMGSDEEKAMSVLKDNRACHKSTIRKHHGKYLKEMGDGTLASFNTIMDSVQCAGELIKSCNEQNIDLRIGIHFGDVISEDHDIFGDGVNVAARLEPLAAPNQILVSESIHRDIKNKHGIKSTFIEEKQLKNVDEKIRVYSVMVETITNSKKTSTSSNIRKPVIVALGFALAILIIYSLANFIKVEMLYQNRAIEKSIAVIPFWNDSSDPENDYFCYGMEEEVRIQLFKISELEIPSRQLVERYREKTDLDVKAIGKELDVAFIVRGSVRKIGNDVRVTIQLIDAKTGHLVWGDTFDGDYTSKVLEFQSSTAKMIASELNAHISQEEEKRIDKTETTEIEAYDYLIKGNYERSLYYKTGDIQHLKNSYNLIDMALEIDPNYLNAYLAKASSYIAVSNYDSMKHYVDKALEIDPNNSFAIARKARYYQMTGKPDLAIKLYLKSLQLEQFERERIGTHVFLGQVYCLQKKDVRNGYPYLKKAMELMRNGEDYKHIFDIAETLWLLGEYEKAKIYLKIYLNDRSCRGLRMYNRILLAEGKFNNVLNFTDSICLKIDCNVSCEYWSFLSYAYLGEFEKAGRYIKEWEEDFGEDIYTPEIGYVYYKLGQFKNAEMAFQKCINTNEFISNDSDLWGRVDYRVAKIYAFQNRKQKALQSIEVFIEKSLNIDLFDFMMYDPMLDNLRNEPEFKEIIKETQEEKAAIRRQIREIDENPESDLSPV